MPIEIEKHQIQYLFPRQAGVPKAPAIPVFPTVDLTNLTDKICIDLFTQVISPEASDTSTVAANSYSPNPAAQENNE